MTGAIQGFDKLSSISRDKIARCLVEKTFMGGTKIITESLDSPQPPCAYIIKEGEIFRQGAPESLSTDPEVRRIYLGESFNLY